MHPLIRLGVELPALRGDARRSAAFTMSLAEVGFAAERAGVATLWLAEAGPGGLDPGPLAGFLAVATTTLGIGVMARPARGRHPSVLARDVSTIDLLSGGRGVVGLVDDGSERRDIERLGEATALLCRLLREVEVTMSGRFYEVAQLTTRPRPARESGPPVVAGITGPIGGLPVAPEVVVAAEVVAAGADGYLTGGRVAEVAGARARIDAMNPAGERPALVWRGELPGGEAGVEVANSMLEAGADGLIAVLGPSAAAGAWFERGPIEDLLAALHPLAGGR